MIDLIYREWLVWDRKQLSLCLDHEQGKADGLVMPSLVASGSVQAEEAIGIACNTMAQTNSLHESMKMQLQQCGSVSITYLHECCSRLIACRLQLPHQGTRLYLFQLTTLPDGLPCLDSSSQALVLQGLVVTCRPIRPSISA